MTTLEVLSVLFATAAFFGLISTRWLKLPLTVGTMLLTVLLSLFLGAIGGLAPGAHQWAFRLAGQIDFESIILRGMLPLLLFSGAFLFDLEQLAREKLTVSLMALIGTLVSIFSVAGLMFLLSAARIPWIQCLLFGALISPTDPIAVLEMLRRIGIPKGIQAQLAGESLFNDGIGAVLFLTVLDIAHGQSPTPWSIAGMLIAKAGGAVLLGILAAWFTAHFMRRVNAYQVDILFTVALALGGYVVADALHLSAPLEAVVAGIALRFFNRHQPSHRIAHQNIAGFWEVIDEIQNSVLFVLLGLETMAITFDGNAFRAGFTAILSINAVRFGTVAGLLALVRLINRDHKSSVFVLTWGGLRGGLSIALALSVPVALGRSWILGATYIVVVVSIVIQGGSMDWILSRSKNKSATA
ncbi:MAG TPA: sodium:proton antiporter [Terracidiphilus sp.]|nr:sodium:proton antiporter [Terracidiphilus sp.]